jgi:short-subunit dehydrogenase
MKANDMRVLLTGASGGIGQAAAAALVRAGAAVTLTGRSSERLAAQQRELARRIDVQAPRVEWIAADLTTSAGVAALVEAGAAWGANVLVHNAGTPSFGRLEALDTDHLQAVLQTNLLAPMLLTHALLPHLRRQPRAQVLCVGSALGAIGLPGYSVYSASKFGLRGFAEALRRELGDSAVRVQYLGPRSTQTDFNDAAVLAYNHATGTTMDAPAVVAEALLRQLEDEAAERFIGFPEKLAVRLNGLAGPLLDGSFKQHRRCLPDAAGATNAAAPIQARPLHHLP